MASRIITKKGSGAPLASDLVHGELAVDTVNKRLYTENAGGTIIELGTAPSTIDINAGTIDGTVIGGSSAAAGTFTTLTASGEITANGGVAFGDNDKATFGASDDLEIYHDGNTNASYITETGTGNLYVRGTNLWLQNGDVTKTYAVFRDGGSVDLYHNGSAKLSTTATGIDVTGTVTADGLSVDGTISLDTNTSTDSLTITGWAAGADNQVIIGGHANADYEGGSYSGVKFYSTNGYTGAVAGIAAKQRYGDGTERQFADSLEFVIKGSGTADNWVRPMTISRTGDISFYDDTGVSQSFYWDASAESLGIGTTSPAFYQGSGLEIERAGIATVRLQNTTTGKSAELKIDTDVTLETINNGSSLIFNTVATERMRIDSAGNVGIGTTSPAAKLEIGGAGEGIILASPDGTRYKITVANGGILIVTAV